MIVPIVERKVARGSGLSLTIGNATIEGSSPPEVGILYESRGTVIDARARSCAALSRDWVEVSAAFFEAFSFSLITFLSCTFNGHIRETIEGENLDNICDDATTPRRYSLSALYSFVVSCRIVSRPVVPRRGMQRRGISHLSRWRKRKEETRLRFVVKKPKDTRKGSSCSF